MRILSPMCSSRRRFALVVAAFSMGLLLLLFIYCGTHHYQRPMDLRQKLTKRNLSTSSFSRKLLEHAKETNRIGESCSKDDIVVYQGPTAPLPSGIPTYTVEIHNMCVSGCAISGIHLSCGWFSSARLINPKIFKRLSYDDCLVNDGKALANGGSLSFQYANTFHYPLSVTSVDCP